MRLESPNLSKSSWVLLLVFLLCAAGLVNLYSISQLTGLGAFKKTTHMGSRGTVDDGGYKQLKTADTEKVLFCLLSWGSSCYWH